jgi:chemotaxis protein MotB
LRNGFQYLKLCCTNKVRIKKFNTIIIGKNFNAYLMNINKSIQTLTLISFLGLLTLNSCIVSKKKFDESVAKRVQVEKERDDLQDQLTKLKSDHESLQENKRNLEDELSKRREEVKSLRTSLQKTEAERAALKNSYDNLTTSSGKLSSDLSKQREELLKAEQALQLSKVENEKLAFDLKEREERVKALEKLIADKEKAVNDLKNRISQALLNFKENDLSVNVKNGKVYVSLAEQLLFKSGSTAVDPKGIQALIQLAGALKNSGDINVLIEGHTDDVPISKTSQYMNDNWDLSVMRATTIARILTTNGVDPTKITAAGRSQYFPVEAGKTPEARQKNRRTEIILTPKLDELFQILESN